MAFDLPEAFKQGREIRRIGSQIESWVQQVENGVQKADGTKQALTATTITLIKAQFDLVWVDYLAAQAAFATALNK